MIVVAIIGILAMVAYPNYVSYVQRGYIGGATSQLVQLGTQLEQYFQDNRGYGGLPSSCGGSGGMVYINGTMTYSSVPDFSFTCAGTDSTFTITAQGTGGMSTYAFTLDEQGNRKTTAFPGASSLPRSCWLLKVGDC